MDLPGSQKALCAADISDMVAAVTNGPAAGIATTSVTQLQKDLHR
eukprot:s6272_g1.t1